MKKDWLIIRLYLMLFMPFVVGSLGFSNAFAQGIEQGLIVNEFSNGPPSGGPAGGNGAMEYMELLVVGCPGQTVDIRNWIFDDNNGDFSGGLGSGKGIAPGHSRFTNAAQWAAVPVGSLILIYNSGDKNPLVPADDPTDANADYIYILSHNNNTLVETCANEPSATNATYTCSGAFSTSGNWGTIGLANTGDACQTRKPDFTYFHVISYGSTSTGVPFDGGPDGIVFAGSGSGKVYSYTSCGYRDPVNFTVLDVSAGAETPGAPNNTINAAYIEYLRNTDLGGTLTPLMQDLTCSQSPSQLSENGVTFRCDEPFQWQSSPTGNIGSFVDITGATEETYTPTIGNGTTYFRRMVSGTCGIDSSNNVSITLTPVPGDVTVAAPKDTCAGPVTLTASGGTAGGYAWFDGPTDGDLIAGENNATLSAIITQSSSYYVALRDGNCVGDKEEYPITITQVTVNAGPDLALTTGQQIDLQATSNGTQFTWSPAQGLSETSILNPVLTSVREGYYILEASNGATCVAKDSFLVSFKDVCQLIGLPNLITPNNDGKNDAFDVGCYISYDWFFEVYNKWGKRVYLADPMTGPWSPDLSPDVYYFYLEDRASGKKFNSWLQIVE